MGKRVFLTQKEIKKIVRAYGGGYRWKKVDENEKNIYPKVFQDKSKKMLIIEKNWDLFTDTYYVAVHFCKSDGLVLKTDKWKLSEDNGEPFFLITTRTNREYDGSLEIFQ